MEIIKFALILQFLCVVFFAGCGEAFNDKPGELEARATLSDIEQARANPNVNNPLPNIYIQSPKRVKVADGVKVFYFTRQQPAAQMATIVTTQLGYKVTANDATNQLIIHCVSDAEADKVLEILKLIDLSPIQVNIDCMIVELYADKTFDRETTIEITDMFGENFALSGQTPTFPGASIREAKRAAFGMGIGYESSKIKTLVDMLVSRGYLKILMNPTIETVNGQKAKIISKDHVPIQKFVTTPDASILPYSITEYEWVEDSLEVMPHVFADGSVGISTEIKIGSSTKPKGVVQASVITERSIKVDENRVKPGYSLVIGGIRKTEKRDVLRGYPVLKDIPVLGMLFSSRDFEESGTELIFILTPSISSGGMEYAKMLEMVDKKQAAPQYDAGLGKILTDPTGDKAYTEHIKQQADVATTEKARIETEAKKIRTQAEKTKVEAEQAQAEAANAVAQAEKAKAEAALERANAEKLQTESVKAQAEAEKAKAEAENARAQAEKSRSEADADKVETEKIKANAEQAQSQAAKAQAEAEQAKAEADSAKAQAEKAKAESEQAQAEAATAKAQADQAQAEAERVKAEAENEKAMAEKARIEAQQAIEANTPSYDPNQPAENTTPVPDANQPKDPNEKKT
jgi:Flp pilus assembly secretin CpaC